MDVVNINFEHQAKWNVTEFLVDKGYEIIVRDWKWWGGQVDIMRRPVAPWCSSG